LCNCVDRPHNNGEGSVPADPAGFDDWCVLPGHGRYHDPDFETPEGRVSTKGYISDLLTDMSLDWLARRRDTRKPFFLCLHHKAPHRTWEPSPKYMSLYADREIPLPQTIDDDYAGRPAAAAAKMRVLGDLTENDVKAVPPAGLNNAELKNWYYQRYIKDYLRCVASVDESVGRLLDYLDEAGLRENTIVIYTSDQGFFLGDHGWYDKRFMYEHSVRMPFLIRYPAELPAGETRDAFLTNVDFAPTLLDYAGVPVPRDMQGRSGRAMLKGSTPTDWQTSFYYRYWTHGGHNVCAHYGVRTHTHKLVRFYRAEKDWRGRADPEPHLAPYWELFDLAADPDELKNVYGNPAYAQVQAELHAELARLQKRVGDIPRD
jgi:arylsulfatase A-like enzyme